MFERYLIGIFGGSQFSWNPTGGRPAPKDDTYRERDYSQEYSKMISWQGFFPDAQEDKIIKDRGDAIYRGYYMTGKKVNQPVAPTATLKNTRLQNATA
jgi:hypothetical protein